MTPVELEVASVEVVTLDEVVKLVDGDTALAIAGMTVVLSTRPATRKLSDPTMTERRGARLEALLGSFRLFCPCVKFNMHQLSETHSTMLPTTAQHPLNSIGHVDSLTNAQIYAPAKRSNASPRISGNARRLSLGAIAVANVHDVSCQAKSCASSGWPGDAHVVRTRCTAYSWCNGESRRCT